MLKYTPAVMDHELHKHSRIVPCQKMQEYGGKYLTIGILNEKKPFYSQGPNILK